MVERRMNSHDVQRNYNYHLYRMEMAAIECQNRYIITLSFLVSYHWEFVLAKNDKRAFSPPNG